MSVLYPKTALGEVREKAKPLPLLVIIWGFVLGMAGGISLIVQPQGQRGLLSHPAATFSFCVFIFH